VANGLPPEEAAPVAEQLAPEVGHSIIEDAVDLHLQQEIGPMAGCLLLNSATVRNAETVQALLVKSYGRNFAARFKIPFAVAQGVISQAEEGFRQLMIYYGAALCPFVEPFEPIMTMGALDAFRLNEFIKAVTGLQDLVQPVRPEDAVPALLAALPLVQGDYQAELSMTLSSLEALRP
jgi:hypothetical protein